MMVLLPSQLIIEFLFCTHPSSLLHVLYWHRFRLNRSISFSVFPQNFEDATHVPFMIRVPNVTDHGMRSSALVELIDIYPTLIDLTGLPKSALCPPNSQV